MVNDDTRRSTVFLNFAAIMFAYLLSPLIDVVHKRLSFIGWTQHNTRMVALGIVFTVLASFVVIGSVSIGAIVVDQATVLANKIPNLVTVEASKKLPVPDILKPYIERLAELLRIYVMDHTQELLVSVSRAGVDVVGAAFSLVMIVVLPIISFYCLKDGRLLSDKLLLLLSPDEAALKVVRAIAADIDLLFGHCKSSKYTGVLGVNTLTDRHEVAGAAVSDLDVLLRISFLDLSRALRRLACVDVRVRKHSTMSLRFVC
jgi:predicted PurR-regulated permease PerM